MRTLFMVALTIFSLQQSAEARQESQPSSQICQCSEGMTKTVTVPYEGGVVCTHYLYCEQDDSCSPPKRQPVDISGVGLPLKPNRVLFPGASGPIVQVPAFWGVWAIDATECKFEE